MLRDSDHQRFLSRVRITTTCHLWTGGVCSNGYGGFYLNGKMQLAHRVAWLRTTGENPCGLVCHTCDNKICVNPAHLYVGNHSTNGRDAYDRGLRPKGKNHPWSIAPRRGVDNNRAKLTNQDVIEIRRRVAAGEYQRVIAKDFGIQQSQVSRIVLRTRWTHI